MPSYSAMSKLTRLQASGSSACEGLAQVMTRREGAETSTTLPTSWTVRSASVRTCCQADPGCQSETFSWPQYRRAISGRVMASNTFCGVDRM